MPITYSISVTGLSNVPPPVRKIEFEEFISTLIKVGMNKNMAKVLTYLACVDEATSKQVETGSDLRQPEVSTAMRELRKMNWVAERNEKTPGKGRPYRIYKLTTELSDMIAYLEEKNRMKIEIMMNQVQRLKVLRPP